ncbi:Degenerin mec-4, partial [Trichostrongylus colubriformis]
MSLIFTVLDNSPTRTLLSTDVDENMETESCVPYSLGPLHSETPTQSMTSLERPIYMAVTQPLDLCYHDTATLHSNPSPLPLKHHYSSNSQQQGSFMVDSKELQINSEDLSGAAKLSACHNTKLKHTMIDFGETTTAHGIPMILNTSRPALRIFWIIFSTVSLVCFCFQSLLVVEKYQKKEKIVNVELEFESAPFPAITICNLNPFKNHLARSVPEISETLDAFHQAVTYSNNANDEEVKRRKRNSKYHRFRFVQYEAVYSACDCVRGPEEECLSKDAVPQDLKSACICNLDRNDGTVWPCYSTSSWMETICPECNDVGYCNVPNSSGNDSIPCVCQTKMGYCILRSEERLKRVWEFRGKKMPSANSPFRDDFLAHLKKLGYGNMTDQVAITTRAKEKLILKMSSLPPQRRAALGYGKSELIKQCSFNSMQCDIEKEFKQVLILQVRHNASISESNVLRLHIDPSFGNCYTFNANPERVMASSRAGPSYGLRLMVFVNSSDYLPTTEAAGVRITIHSQRECPFPDTFGYSAPTGAISSFGISLRKVTRLPGGCFDSDNLLPMGYIYRDYAYEPEVRVTYEPEGCYRNCYQKRIISQCRCADPRFPKPSENVHYCDIRNDII